MTTNPISTPPGTAKANRFALLIGIDYYFSGDDKPSDLLGCVQDVELVETYLKEQLHIPSDQISKLTSSLPPKNLQSIFGKVFKSWRPKETTDKLPTYFNIIEAIRTITAKAQKGDLVYIHYSGHGARVSSKYETFKKKMPTEFDEALVPVDVATNGKRYIHDVELACLLRLMVEKELEVFVVLDCCHSGGAHRYAEPTTRVRGVSHQVVQDRHPSSALTAEELEAWDRTNEGEPDGYTLLAACKKHELAREERSGNGGVHGLLTGAFIQILQERKHNEQLTLTALLNRIVIFVHNRWIYQTPTLEGDGKIGIFDVDENAALVATFTSKYPFDKKEEPVLHAGFSHGIMEKMVFAVYPGRKYNFSNPRLAYAEVQKVERITSTIKITQTLDVVEGLTEDTYCAKFMFIAPQSKKRVKVNDAGASAATLRTELVGSRLIELVGKGADFQVISKGQGWYDVLDSGGVRIPRALPNKSIETDELVGRVTHLVKYSIIRDLRHSDPELGMEVKLLSHNKDRTPLSNSSGYYKVTHGTKVVLAVTNRTRRPLEIAIFNLAPSLKVTQIHPIGLAATETLDSEQRRDVEELTLRIPDDSNSCVDIIRVFATFEPRVFRWLQLPPFQVGRDDSTNVHRGDPGCVSELKELCAAMSSHRDVDPPPAKPCVWSVTDIEIHTKRDDDS